MKRKTLHWERESTNKDEGQLEIMADINSLELHPDQNPPVRNGTILGKEKRFEWHLTDIVTLALY